MFYDHASVEVKWSLTGATIFKTLVSVVFWNESLNYQNLNP